MIKDFWVKNYLSIRDKQTLDFTAKGPASELVVEISEGVFLYKLGVLYGPNASGKSNILIALNEIFRLLVMPVSNSEKAITGYLPFSVTSEQPTEMHVSFYANGIRYDYDVKFNSRFILSETMNYYPNSSKSLFYERTFVGENIQAEINFGASLELFSKTKESIRENTLNNHSVLSVCGKVAFKDDIEQFNRLYGWIMNNYHDVDGDENAGIVDILKEAYGDSKKRTFFNLMLKKADLNILEFKPTVVSRKIPQEFRDRIRKENIPDDVKDALLSPTSESIIFTNKSDAGNFEVPLSLQSKGTQKYIQILGALYDMITGSHVYYLDELGEDFHYDLLLYYLNVFIYNSDKSQLIITSQDTTLLSQDLVNENRGIVWFVEKNRSTASSEYSRGDSFGLHKNLSFYNSYRAGRLGAKPDLGSIFIDLEL